MKLKPGMTVMVELDDEEYQFLLVHTGGNGKDRLSLEAPLTQLLGGMAVGDTVRWRWQSPVPGGETMRVELVGVEEATG